MSDLTTKSRIIFHAAIILLTLMLFLVCIIAWGSYELHRGKIFILTTNRTIQLYESGRTVCRDQGNDWECRPSTIKGKQVFIRGELIQPIVK